MASPVASCRTTLAEEITQEVLLRLWNGPEKFDANRGSLRSFLLAHIHGCSVDLIRFEPARRTKGDNDARLGSGSGRSIKEAQIALGSHMNGDHRLAALGFLGSRSTPLGLLR